MPLQDVADRLIADLVPQIGQRSIRGRPGLRRAFEPSNLRATSLRYQARIVSGRATVATSASALRPNRWPISASVARSASESFSRPFNCAFRMRFSAARYSARASSSWSTDPVTKARMRAQSISLTPAWLFGCPLNRSGRAPARPQRGRTNPRSFYAFNFLTVRGSPCSHFIVRRTKVQMCSKHTPNNQRNQNAEKRRS